MTLRDARIDVIREFVSKYFVPNIMYDGVHTDTLVNLLNDKIEQVEREYGPAC